MATKEHTPNESSLKKLLRCLGKDHPRYNEALTLQSRLQDNIAQAHRYGDTETRRAERAQILDALNRLALETVGISFNALREPAQQTPETPEKEPPPPGCLGRMGKWTVVVAGRYKELPPAHQVALIVALIGLLGTLGAAFIGVMPELLSRPTPTPTATTTPTVTAKPTLPPSPMPTATLAAGASPTPTPLPPTPTPTCAVTASTDAETLFAIIDAEAQAVLDEDIELIKAIFASDATIRNEAANQELTSPEAYYTEKFRNEIHCRAEHYDYRILKLTGEEALVTTANRGEWGWEAEGCTNPYDHPSGADRWHFRKDRFGCWQIIRFTYNAHEQ